MPSQGFAPLAGVAIGAHPDISAVSATPLAVKLARGEEVETTVLIQVASRKITPQTAVYSDESLALAALPIGAAPDLVAGAGFSMVELFGDGEWCGRPDDFGAAHWEADPRIIDVGDFQESAPYLPDQDRRAATTTAAVRAANGDGALDHFFAERAIDGQYLTAYLAERGGYSRDWIRLFDAIALSADPGLDECRFDVDSVVNRLAVGVHRATYAGTGGAQGDSRLAGKFVPVAFGAAPNVEPDRESELDQIDRWHDGALIDVTMVRDRGAPIPWDGNNYETYSELKNAAVAPGFFTKALGLGRTKRGSVAQGRITGDIVAPHNTASAILLALARGVAGLSEDLISAQSFGVLPDSAIDFFFKGDSQVLVEDVFDLVLRPFNAWFGASGDRRLTVGLIQSPLGAAEEWRITDLDIDDGSLDPRRFDIPPVWRLGMTGVRNWTPMTPEELVDHTQNPDLSQETWEWLQREYQTVIVTDSAVRQRHAGAVNSYDVDGPVTSYLSDAGDLDAAARDLFAFISRPMRKVETVVGLDKLAARPGAYGVLQYENRLGLTTGKPAVCVGRRIAGSGQTIAVTSLVVTDA